MKTLYKDMRRKEVWQEVAGELDLQDEKVG